VASSSTTEVIYVADTHAFLWFLAEDKRLSNAARYIFDAAEKGETTIALPTIILAESIRILEKKRLNLQLDNILEKVGKASNYVTLPLDLNVISRMTKLTRLLEIHDRIVVASADLLGAVLITKDEYIHGTGYVQTAW
jgi:PIN domain nuclease of toxin-antitoxin system